MQDGNTQTTEGWKTVLLGHVSLCDLLHDGLCWLHFTHEGPSSRVNVSRANVASAARQHHVYCILSTEAVSKVSSGSRPREIDPAAWWKKVKELMGT